MTSQSQQEPFLGLKVKTDKSADLLRGLGLYLEIGEVVLALVTVTKLRPMLSHVAITSDRIVAFYQPDLLRAGIKAQVRHSDVRSVEVRKSFARAAYLLVTRQDGSEVDFGDAQPDDAAQVLPIATRLAAGAPEPLPVPQAPVPSAARPPVPAQWRFNSPPGWPIPPAGWMPPEGWHPDPAWPPPPPGWQLWVPAPTGPAVPSPTPSSATPPPVAGHLPPATPPSFPPVAVPVPQPAQGHGIFGAKKRAEQLEAENARLRQWIAHMQGMDALQLAEQTEQLRAQVAELGSQAAEAKSALKRIKKTIVETTDVALLQEAGVYDYTHPLGDVVAYKSRLDQIKDQIKTMARSDNAVLAATNWQVNGSTAEGRRMTRDFSKLMLRAYNAEADNLVRTMRPFKLSSSIDRLDKTVATIERLGRTMQIRISPAYHQVRIKELKLTADHLVKVEEEKERIRAEREQQREEQKAQREFEREKARLLKERSHYQSALARLEAKGDEAGAAELRSKLAEADQAIADVEGREAKIRAGYVYVISNVGAFGEQMVKIGMTRRLEPMDRVRELGDASVPFRFDVHALIFSEDAVGLENQLHTAMADRRVNKVNLRREFFYASPLEVKDTLATIADQHLLEFHETPEALEWRQSANG